MIEIPEKYKVWDLETSGFNAPEDKILEIGLMVIEKGVCTEEKRWVLKHDFQIPEEITAINGMTNEIMEAEGRDPKECLKEFMEYLFEDTMNLTHNGVKFDIPFLCKSVIHHVDDVDPFKIMELEGHLYKTCFDTAAIYKGMMMGVEQTKNESFEFYAKRILSTPVRGLKFNVSVCCEYFEIDKSAVTLHRALGDVYLTNEIFKKLACK